MYEESVEIDVKIKKDGSLTIRAGDGFTPTIQSKDKKKAAITLKSSSVTLEGLIIEGGSDRQPGVHIEWSDDHVIRGCLIRGASQDDSPGIYVQGGKDNQILDCDITDNDVGIYLFDEAESTIIRNNRIYRNRERGLWIRKGSKKNEIHQNTFESNGTEIHLGDTGKKHDDAGQENRFSHNILSAAAGGTVWVVRSDEKNPELPDKTKMDYNLLYAPPGATFAEFGDDTIADLGAWQSASGVDVHSISADQLFVNAPTDLHVQPGQSPAIDAGDPAESVGDEPAPNGDRLNLGAFGGTAQAATSGSALPSGAFNSVTAIATGLGLHDVSIEISHSGGTASRARIEWATDPAGATGRAALVELALRAPLAVRMWSNTSS